MKADKVVALYVSTFYPSHRLFYLSEKRSLDNETLGGVDAYLQAKTQLVQVVPYTITNGVYNFLQSEALGCAEVAREVFDSAVYVDKILKNMVNICKIKRVLLTALKTVKDLPSIVDVGWSDKLVIYYKSNNRFAIATLESFNINIALDTKEEESVLRSLLLPFNITVNRESYLQLGGN